MAYSFARTLYDRGEHIKRSILDDESVDIKPRIANELFKENYSAKIVGLENFKDEELVKLREVFKKTFAEVMDYKNDINTIMEKSISLECYSYEFNLDELFKLHFITYLNQDKKTSREKLYFVRDISQDERCVIHLRFRKWVYSFGNENKEKLWYDERPITFLKVIDEINYLLYQRNGKIN